MEQPHVAVVTGSNKGIGQAIATHLAKSSYLVIVNFHRDQEAAEETLRRVRLHSPRSIMVQADVATPAGARELVARTEAEFGRIDVLINNAGPFLVKSLFDTEVDEWENIIDGNLSSAFYCCKAALPLMRAQKGGHIINLGSLNAEAGRGAPTTTAYNVAKAGLVVLTKSLARSEARYGIRSNIVNPGFIETYATSETDKRELPSLIPLGRLGTTDEVANAIDFLLSDQAKYITGAVLNVHGGLWV